MARKNKNLKIKEKQHHSSVLWHDFVVCVKINEDLFTAILW
jgi:hypothetical protein